MKQHILTKTQSLQLAQLALAESPQIETTPIIADLADHPTLWEKAELVDIQSEETDGVGLYIFSSGIDDDSLMQLAIHWPVPTVSWLEGEDQHEPKRILRCFWESATLTSLPN